jgi:hypothetical protein
LQQAIQSADDFPIDALQEAFRRWGGRWRVHVKALPELECD